jgi:cell volume regulation protein A
MAHDARLILVVGGLLAAAIAASLLASRLRLPALILFLGMGMLVGSDGFGWIDFADYRLARLVGTCALVLILFEGGLSAGWREIRPVLRPALLLAVGATIMTAVIAGLVAGWLFEFSFLEAFLLGAILAGTDGAAVFALLRGVALPSRLARTLEAEAGFNDPIAVLLVLGAIELIVSPAYGFWDAVWFLIRELGVGLLAGLAVAWLARSTIRRVASLPTSMALVGTFATAAIAYGSAGALDGSGFLAVYVAGLAVGDLDVEDRPAVLAFHEGLASVAEIGMFLALGLLVFPSQLGAVAAKGLVLAVIVVLIARPVAVAVATIGQNFTSRERVLLGWAGLRGAIPVILATLPVIEHVPRSLQFFNIVFFAVLLSAAVQGITIGPLASRLRVVADTDS